MEFKEKLISLLKYDIELTEGQKKRLKELFPELSKSENEKIIEDCIYAVKMAFADGDCKKRCLNWLEKQDKNIDLANKEYWRGYREGRQEVFDKYAWFEKQTQKPADKIEPKFKVGDVVRSSNDTMLKIVGITDYCYNCVICATNDEYSFGFDIQDEFELVERKPAEWHREDEQNLNTCLGYIPDEFLRRWLTDIIYVKYDKPTDKVEPKFKVGDWIIFNGITLYIKEVVKGFYRTVSKDGITNSYDWGIDNVARLWTIQDAKDGDVLACKNGWTCIFKVLDNHTNTFSSYCFMDNDKWFCNTGSECHTLDKAFIKAYNGEIHPAAKEQRDLLFQKMKEAGYEWDANKKELKKIELQPSQWNISDFRTWQYIVSDVLTKHDGIGQYLDDGFCKKIAKYMQENWSKKLSLGQNSVEWGEEDEANLYLILQVLWNKTKIGAETCKKLEDWLKSLIHQNRWKPSDEQIGVIKAVINNRSFQRRHLDSLYEQLKKLKG